MNKRHFRINARRYYDDARECSLEARQSYQGQTYTELRRRIAGRQDSLTFEKRGVFYEVLISVNWDVENRPDGIQVSFGVFSDMHVPFSDHVFLREGDIFPIMIEETV